MNDRYLPDKALDAIDETASSVRLDYLEQKEDKKDEKVIEVTSEDIARTVSQWTGVPVAQVNMNENAAC